MESLEAKEEWKSSLQLDIEFIASEILPRLEAKTLIRCRCVCKMFNALISSPQFIQRHLEYTSSDSCCESNRLLILPNPTELEGFCGFDLVSASIPTIITMTMSLSRYHVSIIGSCNGFLCVRRLDDVFVLNPITRNSIKFVAPLVTSVGFGFDEIDQDYKVVEFWEFSGKQRDRLVSVYSLRDHSRTFSLGQTAVEDSLVVADGAVVINNSLLHWTFWNSSNRKRRIGCLDLCRRQWLPDLHLPDYYYSPAETCCIHILEIGSLDGRFSCSFKNIKDSCFDGWVMKQYGVRESWTKLFSIPISDPLSGGIVAVASLGPQILLKLRHGTKFVWYNTRNGLYSLAPYHGHPFITPHVYKTTLVPLPGVHHFFPFSF